MKPKNSSGTERYRNTKNNSWNMKMILNLPPRVIWYQFWKSRFPWEIKLWEVFSVQRIMNLFNSKKATGFLVVSWLETTPEWMNTLAQRTFESGRIEMMRYLPNCRPTTAAFLEISLFLKLPHRAFISNPKHPDLYRQLGNGPSPHSAERSRNKRNARCVLKPHSEGAKP